MNSPGEAVYEEHLFDVYEAPMSARYVSQPIRSRGPDCSAGKTQQSTESVNMSRKLYIVCLLTSLMLAISVVVLQALVLEKQTTMHSMLGAAEERTGSSCLDMRQLGVVNSGIHKVHVSDENIPIEVFCDMETDDGGWTLVASIHESDIKRKCTFDDRWSTYAKNVEDYRGKSNWENSMIFGAVRSCLQDDYKNSLFYKLRASNVMIWHVPFGLSISQARNETTLRYRTTNNFLRSYGGNMRNLFNDFKILNLVKPTEKTVPQLRSITASLMRIKQDIKEWYAYRIDAQDYTISDKKFVHDRYTNRVSFISSPYGSVDYGKEHRYGQVLAVTEANTPFTALAIIRNDNRHSPYHGIRVRSYTRRENIFVGELENTVSTGNFHLQYHAKQFSHPSAITECQLYFYVSNVKDWRSRLPTSVTIRYRYNEVSFELHGVPRRIMFGYMLLSRTAGHNYTSAELNGIGSSIITTVSDYPNLMDEWLDPDPFIVPVIFDKGNEETVLEHTPVKMKPFVKPGSLQFGAINIDGYPNAMCPGASVNTTSPEYLCVGGISNDITEFGTCGDFAGWQGVSKSTAYGGDEYMDGWEHSTSDLLSTLLIFYR